MALTKAAVQQLGANIIEHDDIGPAIRMPNGTLKTGRGLIVPPSEDGTGTRSGALASAPDEPIVEEPIVARPRKQMAKKQSTKKQQTVEVVAAPVSALKVIVDVDGLGTIPTQYVHVYPGNGILVIGLNDMSFVPAVSDSAGRHVVSFNVVPGRRFLYCGNKFTDAAGVVNILLLEVKNG